MADVSALLAQYLNIKSQISYYQLEDTKWNSLHEAMSAKVEEQSKAETSYNDKSMDAYDKLTTESTAFTYKKAGINKTSAEPAWSEASAVASAEAYAKAKVPKYDPEKLEEYEALDINYDLMVSTYDTLLEELNAQAESLKTTLGTAAKDTGTIE